MSKWEWREIEGFPGYFVSSAGKVRGKRPGSTLRGVVMKKDKTMERTYRRVLMQSPEGRPVHKLVHRLVAETFLSPDPTRQTVNHRNGNKLDNRLENLEWATPSEQKVHADTNGLSNPATGVSNGNSKLNPNYVRGIRMLSRIFPAMSQSEIARQYGIHKGTVQQILSGKTWKHVV